MLSGASMLRRALKRSGIFVVIDLAASPRTYSMKPRSSMYRCTRQGFTSLSSMILSRTSLSPRFVCRPNVQRAFYPSGARCFFTTSALELENTTKSSGGVLPLTRRANSSRVKWSDNEFELFKTLRKKDYSSLNEKFEYYKRTNAVTAVMYQFMIDSLKSMHAIRKKEALLKLDTLLNEMETLGFPRDIETYNSIFQVMQRYQLPDMIEEYLVDMTKCNIPKNTMTYNILISAFGKCRMYQRVKSLYEEMEEGFDKKAVGSFGADSKLDVVVPDVQTYNTLINVCAKLKKIDEMHYFVDEMQKRDIQPDLVTYNTLLSFYAKDADLYTIDKLLDRMELSGIKPGISTCRALVVACTRAGVFNEQSEKYANMLRTKINQKKKGKTTVWKTALTRYYNAKAQAEANKSGDV